MKAFFGKTYDLMNPKLFPEYSGTDFKVKFEGTSVGDQKIIVSFTDNSGKKIVKKGELLVSEERGHFYLNFAIDRARRIMVVELEELKKLELIDDFGVYALIEE